MKSFIYGHDVVRQADGWSQFRRTVSRTSVARISLESASSPFTKWGTIDSASRLTKEEKDWTNIQDLFRFVLKLKFTFRRILKKYNKQEVNFSKDKA